MSNGLRKHAAMVLLPAVRYLLLGLVVVLCYSIVGAALDIHPNLQRTADCVLCKFTQNLSSAEGSAQHSLLPVPALLRPMPATCCSSFSGTTVLPCFGSRSPPVFLPI